MGMAVRLGGEVKLNGVRYGNSPTDTLKVDIVNDMAGTASISKLDTIELVFSDGSTVDLSAAFTRSGNKLTAQAEWTNDTGSDKTVTAVRLKAGNKVYFESSVSATVPNGGSITINAEVTITLSSTDTDFGGGVLDVEIAKRLSGERASAVALGPLHLLQYSSAEGRYGLIAEVSLSATADTENKKVMLTGKYTPSTNYTVDAEGVVVAGVQPDVGSAANYGLVWFRSLTLNANVEYTFTIEVTA